MSPAWGRPPPGRRGGGREQAMDVGQGRPARNRDAREKRPQPRMVAGQPSGARGWGSGRATPPRAPSSTSPPPPPIPTLSEKPDAAPGKSSTRPPPGTPARLSCAPHAPAVAAATEEGKRGGRGWGGNRKGRRRRPRLHATKKQIPLPPDAADCTGRAHTHATAPWPQQCLMAAHFPAPPPPAAPAWPSHAAGMRVTRHKPHRPPPLPHKPSPPLPRPHPPPPPWMGSSPRRPAVVPGAGQQHGHHHTLKGHGPRRQRARARRWAAYPPAASPPSRPGAPLGAPMWRRRHHSPQRRPRSAGAAGERLSACRGRSHTPPGDGAMAVRVPHHRSYHTPIDSWLWGTFSRETSPQLFLRLQQAAIRGAVRQRMGAPRACLGRAAGSRADSIWLGWASDCR